MAAPVQLLLAKGVTVTGIVFISASTVAVGSAPTAVVPTGAQAGDLLVIAGASATTSFTTPAGWTLGYSNSSIPRGALFYKIHSGAESNVTMSASSATAVVTMLAYRDVSGTPLDTAGTVNATLTTTSLTTTAANSLVISIYTCLSGAGVFTTDPVTGCTTRVKSDASAGISNGLLVVDEIKVAAGATTARSTSTTSAVTSDSFAISFKD